MGRRVCEISVDVGGNESAGIFITEEKQIEDITNEELEFHIKDLTKDLKTLDKLMKGKEDKLPTRVIELVEKGRAELEKLKQIQYHRGIVFEETEKSPYDELSDEDINLKIKGYSRELRRLEKKLNNPESNLSSHAKELAEGYRKEIAELERVQQLRKKN